MPFTHAHRQRLERAAAHYLQECYRRSTAARASEFATFVGLAPPYLSRIAPKIVGMSLRDFLRKQQLEYAVQLLRRIPSPISEIALRCGFGTVTTFYRWFRAAYGTTPGVYRKVMK